MDKHQEVIKKVRKLKVIRQNKAQGKFTSNYQSGILKKIRE